MNIQIIPERPDTADAKMLITELTDYLSPLSPAHSQHGYSVEKLIKQQVQFADLYPAARDRIQSL